MTDNRITIGQIPVDLFTVKSLHNIIKFIIQSNIKKNVLYANAHLINIANSTDKWLVEYFNDKDNYIICDGAGIQLGAKLTSQKIPLKIPYNIWIWNFAEYVYKNNFSMFLLGGDELTINNARKQLLKKVPDLNIVGVNNGYFRKYVNDEENLKVINKINSLKPNILLVGFGMPIQEKWIKENFTKLNTNVILSCGGAFDFIAGNKPVAPKIFRSLNLEWLFRLLLEPKRLWKRYLIGNFKAVYYILKHNK